MTKQIKAFWNNYKDSIMDWMPAVLFPIAGSVVVFLLLITLQNLAERVDKLHKQEVERIISQYNLTELDLEYCNMNRSRKRIRKCLLKIAVEKSITN